MLYAVQSIIFVLTIMLSFAVVIGFLFKRKYWRENKRFIRNFCVCWYLPYLLYIALFTGPVDLSLYPPHEASPYKLPWEAGISRILSQGNRSFTSHRGLHFYAWDFVMPIGTEILAARDGVVIDIEQRYATVGFSGNHIYVRHADGETSGYFHIQKNGALVKVGDQVLQGQAIALSGMTGQTTLPHLHFAVFNLDRSASIPISFREVETGVPLAGHIYKSANLRH